MSDSNWKKYLLKSGLPFEYEVKECFAKQGCTVWDEYSYLRHDENSQEKEFSYDIDANCWIEGNSIDFMIECKYKTEPTTWVFTPDPYGYQNEINQNSFFHAVDYFSKVKFLFQSYPYHSIRDSLGGICLKGVEVYQNQFLETNIFKAINQLSYAFADKLINSMDSQINTERFSKSIFFNIPIIITNAELRLINKNSTTKIIEDATEIEEVTTKHDFLFFHNKIGDSLRKYNLLKLSIFFNELGEGKFKERNESFAKDVNHFIDVLASNYCPQMIVIMHHDEYHNNYQKLFEYMNFFLKNSNEMKEKLKIASKSINDMIKLNKIK